MRERGGGRGEEGRKGGREGGRGEEGKEREGREEQTRSKNTERKYKACAQSSQYMASTNPSYSRYAVLCRNSHRIFQ